MAVPERFADRLAQLEPVDRPGARVGAIEREDEDGERVRSAPDPSSRPAARRARRPARGASSPPGPAGADAAALRASTSLASISRTSAVAASTIPSALSTSWRWVKARYPRATPDEQERGEERDERGGDGGAAPGPVRDPLDEGGRRRRHGAELPVPPDLVGELPGRRVPLPRRPWTSPSGRPPRAPGRLAGSRARPAAGRAPARPSGLPAPVPSRNGFFPVRIS